jgi:hypothetical protein
MAGRGYLGKISAILTADSKGLSRGLNAGAKDVTQFARKIQSTISGATSRAGREFDNILTPLQKLQRALKVGVGQNLKLVNQQEVQAIRQFAEAAERIAKPVSQAAKDFASLSTQVQRNFAPALESAQKAAEQLRASIGNGARVSERDFANLEARINRVTQAASRLREAGQATAGLATGQELRFQRPGFLQQTSRAAALQQQAAALSPEQIRGSGVAALVGQQRQAAQEAENLLSTLERIRVTRNGDAQAAEAAYNRQVAGLRAINDQLEQEITLSRQAAAAAQQLAEAQNRFADAERDRRSGASARRNANAFEDATAGLTTRQQPSASGFGPVVRTMESELARARAVQEQFRALPAETQRQLEDQKARFDSVSNAAAAGAAGIGTFTNAIDRLEQSVRDANSELERLDEATAAARADAQRRAEAASRFLNVDQRESNLISNQGAVSRVNPQQQFLGRVGGEINAVRNQLQELPGVADELGPTVDNLTTRWNNLRRAGLQPTVDDLQRVRQETRAISEALANRGSIASNFSQQFGGAGAAGLGLGIDERALRGIAGEFEFLQNRIAGVAGEARGPLLAAMEQYRTVASRAFRDGTISTEAGRRAIVAAREEVARLAAAVLGVNPRRLSEQLQRVGDVARGGFGNAGLAIQQAAFAVDDFFSVTGGLDQRIRAAGNNISQLGFIIGGTTGLIVGISTAIGAQLVASLIKWYNNGRTTEDQVQALNDALARQKSLVEELAQAFASLGDSIARRAFSGPAAEARAFRNEIEAIADKQRELRESRLLALDEGVFAARADVNVAQNRLARASTRDESIAAQRQLADARRRLAEEEGRVRRQPELTPERAAAAADEAFRQARNRAARRAGGPDLVPGAEQEARREAFDEGERRRLQIQAQLQRARTPDEMQSVLVRARGEARARGDNALAVQLQQLIASLEDPVRRAVDAAVVGIFESADDLARSLEGSQRTIADAQKAGVAGARQLELNLSPAADLLADGLRSLKRAQDDLAANRIDQGLFDLLASLAQQDIERARAMFAVREQEVTALSAATVAVERFAEVLDRARQEAQQNLQQSQSDADQARRADLGVSTPRSVQERRATEESLRRQQESNARVEKEIALAQERFNREVASGGNTQGSQMQRDAARVAEIDRLLNTVGLISEEQRRALIEERSAIRSRVVNQDPAVAAARDADTRVRRQEELAARGRDLAMTPVQRAVEQVTQDAAAINEAFSRDILGKRIVVDEAGRNAALNRLAEQQAQQVAPLLAGFRDERLNAALQGPSRAALNVADTQTVEGSRELNRLLRGDDPNKDVNLVELQKQSDLLQGVIDAIEKQAGPGVVEIRG